MQLKNKFEKKALAIYLILLSLLLDLESLSLGFSSPGVVNVVVPSGQPGQDGHVDEHQASEEEELVGLSRTKKSKARWR